MNNPGAGLGWLVFAVGAFFGLLKFVVDNYRIIVLKIKERKPKLTATQRYEMELEEKRRQENSEQVTADDIQAKGNILTIQSIPELNKLNWNKCVFRLWVVMSILWALYFIVTSYNAWSLYRWFCDGTTNFYVDTFKYQYYNETINSLEMIPVLPIGLLVVWYVGRWVVDGAKSR